MILGALTTLTTKVAAGLGAAKLAMQCAAIKADILGMGMLLDAQSFLAEGIKWASAGVSAFGAGFIISGIMDLGEGNSQQNAAKKNEGISKIVGGIMVCLVGIILVPQIESIFPSSSSSSTTP